MGPNAADMQGRLGRDTLRYIRTTTSSSIYCADLQTSGIQVHDCVREIYHAWFHDIGYNLSNPAREASSHLRQVTQKHYDEVQRLFRTNIPESNLATLEKGIAVGIHLAECSYYGLPIDAQTFVAMLTAVATYIDDQAETLKNEYLSSLLWIARYSPGVGHGDDGSDEDIDGILPAFVDYLWFHVDIHWTPYEAGSIMKAFQDFILGSIIEAQALPGNEFDQAINRNPQFIRTKSGISEAYTAMCFPRTLIDKPQHLAALIASRPLMIDFIDKANDVLSFYKEAITGSDDTVFIMLEARKQRCHPLRILYLEGRKQIQVLQEIQDILGGHPALLHQWQSFVEGYLMFHKTSPRYRLHELGFGQAAREQANSGSGG